jgi:C1A family cysteine protease
MDDLSNGGAIYAHKSILNISDSKFINNTKNAVCVYTGAYNINNTLFDNNEEAVRSINLMYSILNNNTYSGDILVENLTDDKYVLIVNGTGLELKFVNNSLIVENLPSRYDSRDWGWVSSIKDQGFSGGCWVFSTCAALETALLKATGIEYDFSVENIHKNLLQYSKYGNDDISEGGYTYMALNYILSWFGPISEEYDSFDMFGKVDHVIFTNETIHIQDAEVIKRRENIYDNDKVKEAIFKYGAVTGDILITYQAPYFNANTSAWYYNETVFSPAGHAICIVGWDDNYPASNFLITPPGDGAWIIKNSYGEDKYDNGYIYVSYYDTVLGNDSVFIGFVLENTENYNKNYQTGISGVLTFQTNGNYTYKNSYQAIEDDFISAVGTYFDEKNEDYIVEIYVNNELKLTQTGQSPFRGFHTIKLGENIPIKKGDTFTAVIKAHSVAYLNQTIVPLKANVSFIDDGNGFVDISLQNRTLPLKVYTKALENLTAQIDVANVSAAYNTGKYLTATVKDVYGDVLNGVDVTIKLSNGAVSTKTTDKNGQVKLLLNSLTPNTYTATITVDGFGKYVKTNATAKIIVKKDTIKMTAKAKTFKKSLKTKKYAITLKNSEGKAVKNLKVTLKVNGKTYTAKTNSKGQVTFNLKITKKGKFSAVISYKGDKTYEEATKNVKITIR